MNTIKFVSLLIFSLPLFGWAQNQQPVDSLSVLAFGRNGNQATMKPVSTDSFTKKVYFGSGLGGYSPEKDGIGNSSAEEIQSQLVLQLRFVCSQPTELRESFAADIINLIPSDQTLFIDSNIFSNSDLNCLHSLDFLRE